MKRVTACQHFLYQAACVVYILLEVKDNWKLSFGKSRRFETLSEVSLNKLQEIFETKCTNLLYLTFPRPYKVVISSIEDNLIQKNSVKGSIAINIGPGWHY